MAPKVSVVMSVYNGERHLRDAVESVLNQTFRDFEFIIVDDGSTDRTWEILKSYEDPRIVLARNRENIGLTKSLNKGLQMAKGQYIARQDADDISLPERLAKQVEFLESNGEVGLLSCSFVEIDDEGRSVSIQILPAEDSDLQERLLISNCFCHGAAMFRRECLESVGAYREEFEFAQDYDLWLRISERYKVANLEEALYRWRVRTDALSMTGRPSQYGYHFLAQDLAKERRNAGVDKLASLQQEERHVSIQEEFKKHKAEQRRAAAYDYYAWSVRLYRAGNVGGFLKLLLRAMINAPLERDLWLQLLSLVGRKLLTSLRGSAKSDSEDTVGEGSPLEPYSRTNRQQR